MKRRFVVSTDTLTPDQITNLKTEFGNTYWWHWLPNTWLIVDSVNAVSAESLRDSVRKVAPQAQSLVLEVNKVTWASFEYTTKNGKLSDWVKKNWDTD